MNSQTATRVLGACFAALAIFLIGRVIFTSQSSPQIVAQNHTHPQPADAVKSTVEAPSPRKVTIQTDEVDKKRSEVKEEKANLNPPDLDEAFLKQIASLPLDRANFETRIEVEHRIKTSEKNRAKLIYSDTKDGKNIIAYAIKQPTTKEITGMLKPYQMLLDRQTDPTARDYVDKKYQVLVKSYGLTDGRYRLLYAIIPEVASSVPVKQYSYAASSEQDCMDILKQELAPRAPLEIGVPFSPRQGQSSTSYEILRGKWRMDQLVSEELLKPFYNSTSRAQLGVNERPLANP